MPQISYNGVQIELAKENGFLGIEYWMEYYPNSSNPKFRIYTYLGKAIGQLGTYAFLERGRTAVVFKKFEEMNTDTFKPFLLNMERIKKEVAKL